MDKTDDRSIGSQNFNDRVFSVKDEHIYMNRICHPLIWFQFKETNSGTVKLRNDVCAVMGWTDVDPDMIIAGVSPRSFNLVVSLPPTPDFKNLEEFQNSPAAEIFQNFVDDRRNSVIANPEVSTKNTLNFISWKENILQSLHEKITYPEKFTEYITGIPREEYRVIVLSKKN